MKKDKAGDAEIEVLDALVREKEKAARDMEAQTAVIDAAVFDLKAVNPKTVTKVDARTPMQIIQSIHAQGCVVSEALARLNELLVAELKT